MSGLRPIVGYIDAINLRIGHAVAWFTLAMVLVQFVVVVLRYIFGVGSLFLQESVVYLHGSMFMLGSAYTLLDKGHVRVDLFYREADPRWKAKVDLFGHLCLLIPVCVLIFVFSWPYVVSSWASLEGSSETSGIPAVFLMKTVVLLFCALMILQGLAQVLKSVLVLTGAWSAEEMFGAPTDEAAAPDSDIDPSRGT